jgi:Cd2+/Zn2+-exporting ATPase
VAAIGNAARTGVLVKGGAFLEELGSVSVVAFDKTGTLTTGQLEVTDVVPLNSCEPSRVLQIAATIESRSEHPLADAVLRKAKEENESLQEISYFEAMPGKGARAVVDGSVCYVGNKRLLDELQMAVPHTDILSALSHSGKTMMFVGLENEIVGIIAAADKIKESSAEAVSALKRAGIKKTIMLTGDNAVTARAVANHLGIDEVRAELLPEDKVEAIKELVKAHKKVAMVGDGINDAPALAAATVGIAMGGAGTHAALETADIVLMADDLSKLPYAMNLSRRSLRIIKQNVTFAILVVFALVIGALTKTVNLATGVLGHEGSALLVIANSMRLLRGTRRI